MHCIHTYNIIKPFKLSKLPLDDLVDFLYREYGMKPPSQDNDMLSAIAILNRWESKLFWLISILIIYKKNCCPLPEDWRPKKGVLTDKAWPINVHDDESMDLVARWLPWSGRFHPFSIFNCWQMYTCRSRVFLFFFVVRLKRVSSLRKRKARSSRYDI